MRRSLMFSRHPTGHVDSSSRKNSVYRIMIWVQRHQLSLGLWQLFEIQPMPDDSQWDAAQNRTKRERWVIEFFRGKQPCAPLDHEKLIWGFQSPCYHINSNWCIFVIWPVSETSLNPIREIKGDHWRAVCVCVLSYVSIENLWWRFE